MANDKVSNIMGPGVKKNKSMHIILMDVNSKINICEQINKFYFVKPTFVFTRIRYNTVDANKRSIWIFF